MWSGDHGLDLGDGCRRVVAVVFDDEVDGWPWRPPLALTVFAHASSTSVVWSMEEASGPVKLAMSPMLIGDRASPPPAG